MALTQYLEWNQSKGRYQVVLNGEQYGKEVGGKLLCVDGDEFAEVYADATKDPRDDEQRVWSVLTAVDEWFPLVGSNPHVYLLDNDDQT